MPVTVNYPGVYIEELPSGQHSIAPIPTSITVFMGRAPFGPLEPTTVVNFGQFETLFGGLATDYPLSYAVQDFFWNGGRQAIIVRLFQKAADDDRPPQNAGRAILTLPLAATEKKDQKMAAALPDTGLTLQAANPGSWGNTLQAKVDYSGITEQVAAQFDLAVTDLFNLTVHKTLPNGRVMFEQFANLSIKGDQFPNRIDRILAHQSILVAIPSGDDGKPVLPQKRPLAQASGNASQGNDGSLLQPATYIGKEDQKTGLFALDKVDIFNLLCIPPDQLEEDINATVWTEAVAYCVKRRAFLIVDSPASWTQKAKAGDVASLTPNDPAIGIVGTDGRNAAIYFPRVIKQDLGKNNQPAVMPACGLIAGVYANTDLQRGVWKAPAGQEATLVGIEGLAVKITDVAQALLNPVGINCLREFPVIGPVIWGARTLRGADVLADEYKYVNVRRLALFIEESLQRGTQWAVFEPNDESLWAALRLSIQSFMVDLQRQGAFYNYQVTCDATTTTSNDIELGFVNILVAFAPVQPVEFIVLQIQQQTASLSG